MEFKNIRGCEIRLTRIGSESKDYFQELIPKLLKILTDPEKELLLDKIWCNKTFGINYPFLNKMEIIDKSDIRRTYKNKMEGYFVCSQWYNKNFEKLAIWLKNLGSFPENG